MDQFVGLTIEMHLDDLAVIVHEMMHEMI